MFRRNAADYMTMIQLYDTQVGKCLFFRYNLGEGS